MRPPSEGRLEFLALTPVALRAPSVSAKNSKSVHDVPGTKCIRCAGIDRHSCRRLVFRGAEASRRVSTLHGGVRAPRFSLRSCLCADPKGSPGLQSETHA